MENKTIKIELESPLCIGDWNDDSLTEVIQGLQSVLDAVPDEHKKNVKFKLNQSGDEYDGYGYVEHEIYYFRKETDLEAEDRIKQTQARLKAIRENEIAQLEALKAKYPDKNG